MHTCPVCGFDKLEFPPANHTICDCCGTEFGLDDYDESHAFLRLKWMSKGMTWFNTFSPPPKNWSGRKQLIDAGLIGKTPAALAVAFITPMQEKIDEIRSRNIYNRGRAEKLMAQAEASKSKHYALLSSLEEAIAGNRTSEEMNTLLEARSTVADSLAFCEDTLAELQEEMEVNHRIFQQADQLQKELDAMQNRIALISDGVSLIKSIPAFWTLFGRVIQIEVSAMRETGLRAA